MTLDTLKQKSSSIKKGGRFSEENKTVQKEVIDFHYKSGMRIEELARELEFHPSTLYAWKKKYGKQRTGYIHGNKVRNDVRTRCLAVAEIVSGGKTLDETSKKYNVSKSTVYGWINLYENNYMDYIDTLPDGIPYIIKEEKQIYGNENIAKVEAMLISNAESIDNLLRNMHLSNSEKNILTAMNSKVKKKLELIDDYKKIEKEILK